MEPRELVWLRRSRDLCQMLGSERDPRRLPARILDAALELTGAERAFLVRVQPGPAGAPRLRVLAGRGFFADTLSGPEGEVSRTVVERALEGGGRTILTTRQEDAALIERTTLASRGVRSLVCLPLQLRGELIGVLYLDHRQQEGLFREADLPVLASFATQAALCLALAEPPPEPAPAPEPEPGPGPEAAPGMSAQHLVGRSPALEELREEVRRAALSHEPVLVCGEPGTEGALVALELHARGGRGAFQRLGCADQRLRPALLGGPGAPGLLHAEGTLCLEEVERLEPELQRTLGRALADGASVLPGTAQRLPLRARLVALTAVDLFQRVEAGSFRPELYYRLDTLRLVVPPLRQRREDLPLLVAALLTRMGAPPLPLTPEALEHMARYAWPGNLLELESELRRLRGLDLPRLGPEALRPHIRDGRGVAHTAPHFSGRTLGELEEELVRAAMRDCRGVKAQAARQLGIPRSTLYHLLERYGIE